MANEQIQRWDLVPGNDCSFDGDDKCLLYPVKHFGVWVKHDDHLAATTDLREGQMHLAMELERKDEQIRKLREALENQIKYCSNGMIHTTALAALKAGE